MISSGTISAPIETTSAVSCHPKPIMGDTNMMTVYEFHYRTLRFANELRAAADASTPETWPANRDAVLAEWGCEDLAFLTLGSPD